MRHCVFLTLEDRGNFFIDDEYAYEPLQALGYEVEAIPWNRRGVDWRKYDAVIIRSTWDYWDDPDAFLVALREIAATGALLLNDVDLVAWNLNKSYLRDLAGRGVPIVPTVWRERLGPGELLSMFDEIGTSEIVVKPVISAGARNTFRLDRNEARERAETIEAFFSTHELMAQPFVPAVVTEGEYSLFYFNGEPSHAILKTPKARDFRVQEEFGGLIRAVEAEASLRAAGEVAVRAIETAPLYARADFVRATDGHGFWLMELELIEPSLYLRMDDNAPKHLARAIHERVMQRSG